MERVIIGFSEQQPCKTYCIISLEDGMVLTINPEKEAIAKWLNDYRYQPVEVLDRKRQCPF